MYRNFSALPGPIFFMVGLSACVISVLFRKSFLFFLIQEIILVGDWGGGQEEGAGIDM